MSDAFPLRVAAIDVGSNAIRFHAAEFLHPAHYSTLEQVRTPVRLGESAFGNGMLAKDAIKRALEALSGYVRRIDALDVQKTRAVATSAVRDSRNGTSFVRRVLNETGLELETITGAEEMRLVHQAVRSRVDLKGGRWVLADLGGGSCEIAVAGADHVHESVSHGIGTVRLLQELAGGDSNAAGFEQRVEEYLDALRIQVRPGAKGLIATGGNMEALAKLAAADPDENGVSVVPLNVLRSVRKRLARLSCEQRVTDLDLRPDRADVIIPAVIAFERICVASGLDRIHVPHVGVQDGVLLDLVDDLVEHVPHARRQEQVVLNAALAVGRRFRFEAPHARHVCMLALSLFDQMEALHGLDDRARRLLLGAAILHDVGTHIGYQKHHKHSYYIISQTDLPGFSRQETELVAQIARYHRKGEPAVHHDAYMSLEPGERTLVSRLAAILRVADALDREHQQSVARVHVKLTRHTALLEIDGRGGLSLEKWAIEKKGRMFERIFDRELEVEQAGDPS